MSTGDPMYYYTTTTTGTTTTGNVVIMGTDITTSTGTTSSTWYPTIPGTNVFPNVFPDTNVYPTITPYYPPIGTYPNIIVTDITTILTNFDPVKLGITVLRYREIEMMWRHTFCETDENEECQCQCVNALKLALLANGEEKVLKMIEKLPPVIKMERRIRLRRKK
jgi:hypothetical protein